MEEELKSMAKVTAYAFTSLTYARYATSITRPGLTRLTALLPTLILLPFLPLHFQTLHLRVVTIFFLSWLAVFKLLLLSFGSGPLSSPDLSLLYFVFIASLPLKLRTDSFKRPSMKLDVIFMLRYVIKILILIIAVDLYKHKHRAYRFLVLALYNLHFYVAVDLLLTSFAFGVGSILRIDLDPQFEVPLKSNSLQDFWGRRWNLMVTDVLRPTVYDPVKQRYGRYAGIMASFAVSGIMHEIMFGYLDLDGPPGEAFLFFFIQGIFTVLEVRARKEWGFMAHPMVRMPIAIGFVILNSSLLLFRPLMRNGLDDRLIDESRATLWFFLGGLVRFSMWVWRFMHS